MIERHYYIFGKYHVYRIRPNTVLAESYDGGVEISVTNMPMLDSSVWDNAFSFEPCVLSDIGKVLEEISNSTDFARAM